MGDIVENSDGGGHGKPAKSTNYRTSSLFPPETFIQQLGLDKFNFKHGNSGGGKDSKYDNTNNSDINDAHVSIEENNLSTLPPTELAQEEEINLMHTANLKFVRSTSRRKITLTNDQLVTINHILAKNKESGGGELQMRVGSGEIPALSIPGEQQQSQQPPSRDSIMSFIDNMDDDSRPNTTTKPILTVAPISYPPQAFQEISLTDTPRANKNVSRVSEEGDGHNAAGLQHQSTSSNAAAAEDKHSLDSVKRTISIFLTEGSEDYIYGAEDTNATIVYDESGKIKNATFVKIVEKLTDDRCGDANQLFVFLNTYRTFTTPLRLMQLLSLRYNMPDPQPHMTAEEIAEFDRAKRRGIRLRVMVVFKSWIEGHWIDWQENEEMLDEFKVFVQKKVIPSGLQKSAEILTNLMAKKRLDQIERDSITTVSTYNSKQFDFWSCSVNEIALQLTLIEFTNFRAIKPYEFLKLAWAKKNARQNAPNIMTSIEFFNTVAEWIKTEMLVEDHLQRRIAKLTKFLELGERLLVLNNFNGLAEVVAALDSSPIFRLKKTWAGLPEHKQDTMQMLRDVVAPAKSYAKLRERLHTATPPCVPYLGMYLTDLTFIDEGNLNIIDDMINFNKCMMISDVLREIQLYQQTKYNDAVNPLFKKYILGIESFGEDDAYDISLEIEPRVRNDGLPEEEPPRNTLDMIKNTVTLPQELLSTRLVGKKTFWGKKQVLNLSSDPFHILLHLLGSPEPLTVRLPPKCTASMALQIFEENFRGVSALASAIVLIPSPTFPCGKVIDTNEFLEEYSFKNNDTGPKPVLMVWRDPCMIRVGVSRNDAVERTEEMIVDLTAPLFSMVPIFQNVFSIKDEFSFLYIEGTTIARWMNMGRTLQDQAFDYSKGFLLLFPLVNLLNRPLMTLGNAEKSGFLTVKKKDMQAGKFSVNMLKKRYFAIHDHFLIWFTATEPESLPRALISLEHFTARLGSDKIMTLFRHFRGFSSTISKYNVYKLTALTDDEIVDWFALVQKCRGSIGDQAVFGVPLAVAAGKRGNKKLPLVVEKTITFLAENDLYRDQLFAEACNPELLEHYIDQFDQGAAVDFLVFNHPQTVAQLLLVYLDMLPSPVITHDLFDRFLELGARTAEGDGVFVITDLSKLIAELPQLNRAVLCFIFDYLHKIPEREPNQDMANISRRVLAKAFAPVLLKSKDEYHSHVIYSGNRNSFPVMEIVVERLLFFCKQLFTSKGSEGKFMRQQRVRHKLTMIQGTATADLKTKIAEAAQMAISTSDNIITGGGGGGGGSSLLSASSSSIYFSPMYDLSASTISNGAGSLTRHSAQGIKAEQERVQTLYGTGQHKFVSHKAQRFESKRKIQSPAKETKVNLGRDESNEPVRTPDWVSAFHPPASTTALPPVVEARVDSPPPLPPLPIISSPLLEKAMKLPRPPPPPPQPPYSPRKSSRLSSRASKRVSSTWNLEDANKLRKPSSFVQRAVSRIEEDLKTTVAATYSTPKSLTPSSSTPSISLYTKPEGGSRSRVGSGSSGTIRSAPTSPFMTELESIQKKTISTNNQTNKSPVGKAPPAKQASKPRDMLPILPRSTSTDNLGYHV